MSHSRKFFWTVLALALIVGLAYQRGWILSSNPPPASDVPLPDRTRGTPDVTSREELGDLSLGGAPSVPTHGEEEQPAYDPATREQMLEEVRNDPHGIPVSHMRMAEQMSDLMASAEHSPEQAEKVFEQLKNCVEDPDDKIPQPVRVHCLFNAKVLAEKNSNFSERFKRLEGSVPQLVQFLKDTGLDSD